MMTVRLAVAAGICISIVGCSSIELSDINANGVVFTGDWVLDADRSDVSPNFRKAVRRGEVRDGVEPRARTRGRNGGVSPLGSGISFVTHDFQVLDAEALVIEQSADSMGVRYTPGVYRDVSWGERQRGLWEVYAGWEGDDIVILSEAPDLRVTERFALRDRDRLLITVEVRADGEEFEVNRHFTRR